MRLRTDCGTITVTTTLVYGSSINNQRIESWWSIFRKGRFGSRDCGFQIEQAELDALPEASLSMTPCGDPNMQEYLDFAMEHDQLQKPENWESASELYMKLKEMAQL
ncbi:hypothetical protein cypCar_00036526 [Cyprinus carpio]|nr:hypothetical protein cypCar_00036526 [Cyprinus carpio]